MSGAEPTGRAVEPRADAGIQRQKLVVPEPPLGLLPRRILDQVTATPPGGTTMLVAAPGFGRTSAAAAAVRSTGAPVAWVSVDTFDVRPGRLVDHLCAAVSGALRAPIPTADDELARVDALIDVLAQAREIWLVLDDAHHLRDAAALRTVAYLVSRLPSTVHAVISCAETLLPILGDAPATLRVLDETVLALSPDEAWDWLVDHGVRESAGPLRSLVAACDGWLRALAEAAADPTHDPAAARAALVTSGAERLLAAWWSGLNESWRDLLLETVELERLHPALCDIVRGRHDSAEILFEIVSAHGYLRPSRFGDVLSWQRHPLLTHLLRNRSGAVALPAEQHLQIAAWAATHGDVDTRIRHLAQAGRVDEARALIHAHEDSFYVAHRIDEVLEWYRLVDVADDAGLVLRMAWARHLIGDTSGARAEAGRLRSMLPTPPLTVVDQEMAGEAAVVSASLALGDADSVLALREAREAARLFGSRSGRNAHAFVPLVAARALLWSGQLEAAEAQLDSEVLQRPMSPELSQVLVPAVIAALRVYQGRVLDAEVRTNRALEALESGVVAFGDHGLEQLLIVRGLAGTDLGRYADATQDLTRGLRLARGRGMLAEHVVALIGLARAETLLGDPRRAVVQLEDARALLGARTPTSSLMLAIAAAEALARLRLGDGARAERLIAALPASTSTALLEVRLGQLRRPGSGETRLERVATDTPRAELDRLVLLAEAVLASSTSRAAELLGRIGDLALHHGLHTSLCGQSPALVQLAATVAARSTHEGLGRLVTTADTVPAAVNTAAQPLSAGERELLVLLPGRDTNEMMAARMSVSVNTVKTRLKRLYAKLGAGSRDEAVRIARERGYLR